LRNVNTRLFPEILHLIIVYCDFLYFASPPAFFNRKAVSLLARILKKISFAVNFFNVEKKSKPK